ESQQASNRSPAIEGTKPARYRPNEIEAEGVCLCSNWATRRRQSNSDPTSCSPFPHWRKHSASTQSLSATISSHGGQAAALRRSPLLGPARLAPALDASSSAPAS